MIITPSTIKYCKGEFEYPGIKILLEPKYLIGGMIIPNVSSMIDRSLVHMEAILGVSTFVRGLNEEAPTFRIEKVTPRAVIKAVTNLTFQINIILFSTQVANTPLWRYKCDIEMSAKSGILNSELKIKRLEGVIKNQFPDGGIPLFQGRGSVVKVYNLPNSRFSTSWDNQSNVVHTIVSVNESDAQTGADIIY